jgi:uncharacterized protein DUF3223
VTDPAAKRRGLMIGDTFFRTKKDVLATVREIKKRNIVDVPLQGADLAFMRDVLDLHPSRDEKLARGFAGIAMRLNLTPGGAPDHGFHVLHPDGTSSPFSFLVALGVKPAVPDPRAAARFAVADDIVAYKKQRFAGGDTIIDDETGEELRWEDAEVDHAGNWPFRRIWVEYVIAFGRPNNLVKAEQGIGWVLPPAEAERFREFHKQLAVLRIVHRDVNAQWRGAK